MAVMPGEERFQLILINQCAIEETMFMDDKAHILSCRDMLSQALKGRSTHQLGPDMWQICWFMPFLSVCAEGTYKHRSVKSTITVGNVNLVGKSQPRELDCTREAIEKYPKDPAFLDAVHKLRDLAHDGISTLSATIYIEGSLNSVWVASLLIVQLGHLLNLPQLSVCILYVYIHYLCT
jgi:hypothetical protein